MKKLFFIAALAIVAVGGAFAQYKDSPESEEMFTCSGLLNEKCTFPIYDAVTGIEVDVLDPAYTQTRIDL